jgi:glutamine phosphoribosylpyrophosphate amidotransferase
MVGVRPVIVGQEQGKMIIAAETASLPNLLAATELPAKIRIKRGEKEDEK